MIEYLLCSKSISYIDISLMHRKTSIIILSLLLIVGFSTSGFTAKVPAPEKGGDGFKAVSLEEAKKLHENGATMVACHSHTTDFMKGHPSGTKDKNTPIITYCASST
ncbi:MAG: hypothetical protein JRJ25_05280 [Deltaproteobacteria bacterium]|nr:hypothetical protein [Deltaproteobacteria bacterium]